MALRPPILVTGAAGFIGAAVSLRLLQRGEQVVGVDNLNSDYDPALKRARLERLAGSAGGAWQFQQLDVADGGAMAALFATEKPRAVLH